MEKSTVVIGGNGFIGYSVIAELIKRKIKVKCITMHRPDDNFKFENVEYYIGDVWDHDFFQKAIYKADCVMDFVSTSMPNTNDVSLSNEIGNTLRYHDYVLSTIVAHGIKRYIFPSSGGAIYGNKPHGLTAETDTLNPTTPYGVGKQMTENMIQYYHNKCSLAACVLRIGNVYGSPKLRRKEQGVVDVFTQKALRGENITIWGNAQDTIRDYIYMEDVACAVADVYQMEFDDYRIYNVGTGRGTCLTEILSLIKRQINEDIHFEYKNTMASGINGIVLSTEKIKNEVKWESKVSIEEGIKRTIAIKRKLLNL